MRDKPTETATFFSKREPEVLAEVGHGLRNEEIADRLGISGPGCPVPPQEHIPQDRRQQRADAVR